MEYSNLDPALFEICIKLDPDELTPDQKSQIQYGNVYSHAGFIQFAYSNNIYVTRDNEIVRNYLNDAGFKFAEYGIAPVVDIDNEYLDNKFNKLHGEIYGDSPSEAWVDFDNQKETELIYKYRKYAALFCDRTLMEPAYYGTNSTRALRSFVSDLKEINPFFKNSTKDFKDTPIGEAFSVMLRDKRLKGEEFHLKKKTHDIINDDPKGPENALLRLVKKHLSEEQYKLLEENLTSSYLDKNTINFYSDLLSKAVAPKNLEKKERDAK